MQEEEFDIETINFDEYNRQIYLDKVPSHYNGYRSQVNNTQKKYKSEIEKYVEEYKNQLTKNEIDEAENFRFTKKRKI